MILTSLYQFLSSRSPRLCQSIYREELPQEHPLPALTFELDADDDVQLLDGTQGSLHEALVTLNCYDPSALVADALAASVKNVLVGYTGAFGSYTAQCIYKENETSAPETVSGLRGVSLQFFIAYF